MERVLKKLEVGRLLQAFFSSSKLHDASSPRGEIKSKCTGRCKFVAPLIFKMTVSVVLPDDYGYVILTTVFCHMIVTSFMGHRVMQGREKYKVGYPNLYATPGYHKEADAFNRLQRGHQNFIETLPIFMFMNMIGGLKHPRVAAVSGLLHCVGLKLFNLSTGPM
jgi:glutathione S-transferase